MHSIASFQLKITLWLLLLRGFTISLSYAQPARLTTQYAQLSIDAKGYNLIGKI